MSSPPSVHWSDVVDVLRGVVPAALHPRLDRLLQKKLAYRIDDAEMTLQLQTLCGTRVLMDGLRILLPEAQLRADEALDAHWDGEECPVCMHAFDARGVRQPVACAVCHQAVCLSCVNRTGVMMLHDDCPLCRAPREDDALGCAAMRNLRHAATCKRTKCSHMCEQARDLLAFVDAHAAACSLRECHVCDLARRLPRRRSERLRDR